MQKFIVQKSFWDLFPDAAIGVVVARNMKTADEVSEQDREAISQLLAQANVDAVKYLTRDTLSENKVVAVWRDAYKRFKTKKGVRCSLESLLKRIAKGNPVGHITPVVDLYNAISLGYALPAGSEDIGKLSGNVRLGITHGDDAFRALGEEKDDPTLPGEMCYYDDEGAICRCLNWRDGVRTALTDDSRNAFLVMECVDASRLKDLRAAINEFADLAERYMGATITAKQIVTRESPEAIIADDDAKRAPVTAKDQPQVAPMRRTDRATTIEEARELMKHCLYGVLSTTCPDGWPYAVPVSYAFDGMRIVVHCAPDAGQKLQNLQADSRACFTVVGNVETLPSKFSTIYESAVALGTVHVLEGIGQKKEALQMLIDKYSSEYQDRGRKYIESMAEKTCVLEMQVHQLTGKARRR